jgi:hypothetical protein
LCKIPEIQEELSFCAVSIVFLICWISAFISSDFLLYPPSSKSFWIETKKSWEGSK